MPGVGLGDGGEGSLRPYGESQWKLLRLARDASEFVV